MKIESIIRRKNGTRVELDDSVYHFKPTPEDERHLCEVTVHAHIKRFLSITEGFQPADLDELKTVAADISAPVPAAPDRPVLGSLVGVQEKDGTVTTLPELPREQLLILARDMDIADADSLSDEELAEAIRAEEVEVVEEPGQPEEEQAKQPVALDRDALVEQYKAKFGRAPHHKLSAERIAQILAEDAE